MGCRSLGLSHPLCLEVSQMAVGPTQKMAVGWGSVCWGHVPGLLSKAITQLPMLRTLPGC